MCSNNKVQLKGYHACPTISRHNDFSLIEKAVLSGEYMNMELKHIQKCLLYLRVLHLLDISSGDG